MNTPKESRYERLVHLKGYISSWLVKESIGKSIAYIDGLQRLVENDANYIERLVIGIRSNIIEDKMTARDMIKCNKIYKKYKAISDIKLTLKENH